jgi:hypothetical protein
MKSTYSSLVAGLAVLVVTCSAAPYVTLVGDELDFAQKHGYIREPRQVKERTVDLRRFIVFPRVGQRSDLLDSLPH